MEAFCLEALIDGIISAGDRDFVLNETQIITKNHNVYVLADKYNLATTCNKPYRFNKGKDNFIDKVSNIGQQTN